MWTRGGGQERARKDPAAAAAAGCVPRDSAFIQPSRTCCTCSYLFSGLAAKLAVYLDLDLPAKWKWAAKYLLAKAIC